MKRSKLKRICIVLLQHLLAIGILFAAAGIMLNSFIEVESIDGTKMYKIFPFDSRQEFEDSDIYQDLFRNSISDITQLVVIRSQFETDDAFDPTKTIDVTEYAAKIGAGTDCAVKCTYELDDLIKWGRAGVTYSKNYLTMSQFVNYFGYCIFPENYKIDEYGQLVFDGFYRIGENTSNTGEYLLDANGEIIIGQGAAYYGKSPEEVSVVWERMQNSFLTQSDLEGMAFAYIMGQNVTGIEVDRENEKNPKVIVSTLNCRYNMSTGASRLNDIVDNWVDFLILQNNIEKTVVSLNENYQRYQLCKKAYMDQNSNVKYVVRMNQGNRTETYSNLNGLKELSDEEITENFSEFRRYLIYYPDSLAFMGNTILSEEEFYKYLSVYEYAYPDSTHIWLGVDTNYSVRGDAFYNANALYNEIGSKVWRIVAALVILTLGWIIIAVYCSVTTGVRINEDGEIVHYLKGVDHLWTELMLALSAAFGYGAYLGYQKLVAISEQASVKANEYFVSMPFARMYQYGLFGLYGLYLSITVCIVWYSFVRRVKNNTLWTGSLIYAIGTRFASVARYVFRHRNAMISVLLPFNLYFFTNLIAVIGLYQFRGTKWIAVLIIIGLVVFNGIVGMLLFKQHTEQNIIIDGINKIRDGEVDYVLASESLHGINREMAESVNNIGEGIRKAVKTSMKDEQMKTDLITNVSHDIKTPLTSIINYVDLLKRLKITEEPAKGYIDILDNKAHRLKQLTDDLVEASKISSGNIILNMEKLNLTELVNQGIGEFSEEMESRGLTVIFENSNTPAYILADSRRMWRVVENLLKNICKYAMENTRVYFDMEVGENLVSASVKNISKQQMNIRPDELTERFIRGDSARSTEGSGLGLSIAKSLVQAQGGEFTIYLDGDLFKVTISFPKYEEPEKTEETAEEEKESGIALLVEEVTDSETTES